MPSRRQLLASSAGCLTAIVAGCTTSHDGDPDITIEENHTDLTIEEAEPFEDTVLGSAVIAVDVVLKNQTNDDAAAILQTEFYADDTKVGLDGADVVEGETIISPSDTDTIREQMEGNFDDVSDIRITAYPEPQRDT